MNKVTHFAVTPQGQLKTDELVEGVFQRGTVNLIGGPNRGDTQAVLLMLASGFKSGGRFLDRQVKRGSYIIISRDLRHRVLEAGLRLGLAVDEKLIFSILDLNLQNQDFETVIDKIGLADGTVVLVEQLMMYLMPNRWDSESPRVVSRFLLELERLCTERNLTIIGSHLSAKIRQRDLVYQSRQRLYGSVAWGDGASTVLWVQPENLKDVKCKRRLVDVTFRNGQGFYRAFDYDELGKLIVPIVSLKMDAFERISHDGDSAAAQVFQQFFAHHKDESFRTADFLQWGLRADIGSERTLERCLQDAKDDGIIVTAGHGRYRRARVQ